MKRTLHCIYLVLIIIGTAASATCQNNNYYIFIQSENKEPFYVQANSGTYSSTSSGYAIVPRLSGGNTDIRIGFAKNKYKEQVFGIAITNDFGFLLKKDSSNIWTLTNLQDAVTIKPGERYQQQTELTASVESKSDSATMPPPSLTATKPLLMIKIKELATSEGLTQTYVDLSEKRPDTVEVFIPAKTTNPAPLTVALTDSLPKTCTIASVEDFMKTRARMASAESEKAMLAIANTAFSEKCFSTEQIKNLGVLFLSDAGKIQLYSLAKPSVYDNNNFGLLQKELTDPAALQQFKNLAQ